MSGISAVVPTMTNQGCDAPKYALLNRLRSSDRFKSSWQITPLLRFISSRVNSPGLSLKSRIELFSFFLSFQTAQFFEYLNLYVPALCLVWILASPSRPVSPPLGQMKIRPEARKNEANWKMWNACNIFVSVVDYIVHLPPHFHITIVNYVGCCWVPQVWKRRARISWVPILLSQFFKSCSTLRKNLLDSTFSVKNMSHIPNDACFRRNRLCYE